MTCAGGYNRGMPRPEELPTASPSVPPHAPRAVEGRRLRVSPSGEILGSAADVQRLVSALFPKTMRLPEEKPGPVELPSVTLEVVEGGKVLEVLRGVTRASVMAVLTNGEPTSLRFFAAKPAEGGIRRFDNAVQAQADAAVPAISSAASGAPRPRGIFGRFLHRIGLAVGWEASLREEEGETVLSGAVEGGKHIPTAQELAKRFLVTAVAGGGEKETSLGSRTRYLKQLMEVAPKEVHQCTRAANAEGLKKLQKSLLEVAEHPAFASTLEGLARGADDDVSTTQGMMGGGHAQSERVQQLRAKYGGLQQTAASRLARLEGKVVSYGPPRQAERTKASGTMGGWKKRK